MLILTKIKKKIESDVPDLVMKYKINGLVFINCLLYLEIIFKKLDKISMIKDLEIKNKLKELETEKMDELELL